MVVFSASDLHAKFMQAEKPRQHRVRMFAPPKMLSVGTPIYISVIFQHEKTALKIAVFLVEKGESKSNIY